MKAIYAGTFDPPTLGHLDVIRTATNIGFDVVWLFAVNNEKKTMFSLEDRIKMARFCLNKFDITNKDKVNVDFTPGLIVEYAKDNGINVLIRSFRNEIDVSYEMQVQQNNAILAPNIKTIFIPPNQRYIHISSSAVRMFIKNNYKDKLFLYVPTVVELYIEELREHEILHSRSTLQS